nr:hypothetical protein GCM10020063_032180 [Dactylosporangium thailandense]
MDGHWEWSDGDDSADTADLGGDAGHDLHGDFSEDYGAGFDADHADHAGYGGDEHDLSGPGHHLGDGSDIEEPLGTEHATAEYDESLHDGHDGHSGQDGHDDLGGHDEGQAEDAAPAHLSDGQPDYGDVHGDVHDAGDTGHDQHEAAFGVDPDVDASADDPAWHEVQFPEELHLQDPPEPVDGFPWTDADVLGGPDHSQSAAFDPAVEHHGPAEPAGLADYAHLDVPAGTDPWSMLLGSEDPAASSLATFWAPQ